MLVAEIIGVERTLARLGGFQAVTNAKLYASMVGLALKLQKLVISDYLSGQVLNVRTGHLRRSISESVKINGTTVIGEVHTNVEYAHIQEYGGKIKAHDIFPKKARALLFGASAGLTSKAGRYLKSGKAQGGISKGVAEGSLTFAKSVHHPGATIPERSFLRAALNDMAPEIRATLTQIATEALK